MIEAHVPNYTAVPCHACIANPGQPCHGGGLGSCRRRRQLWGALREAQSRGQNGVQWNGRYIQIITRLK